MNFGMCGRWRNGRLASICTMAGSEECDFECPHRDEPAEIQERPVPTAPYGIPGQPASTAGVQEVDRG